MIELIVGCFLLLIMATVAMSLLAAVLPVLLVLFCVGIGVAFFAFWVWMLVDSIQNRGLREGEKIGWVLAIIFLHLVGAPLYFFFGRPKRHALTCNQP